MANNVRNVRFLRNTTIFANHGEALTQLNGYSLSSEQDGSIIIARYYGDGNKVKSLVGVVYYNASTSANSITVIDVEGSSADVEELRQEINAKLGTGITSANTATAQLKALSGDTASTSADTSVEGAKRYADDLISTLDYADTAVTGSYVSAVNEVDGKIAVTRVALPSKSSVSGESKVIIDVTEDKGEITASAANLTGVKLAGYAEAAATGDVASTDTLGEALGKLQKTIHEMDKTASAEDGKVVTTVSEVDGVVSETKANVKDLQLGGYSKTNDTGPIASADTINVALSKLENKAAAVTINSADGSINVTTSTGGTNVNVNIKSGEHVLAKDGNAGLYTNISLSSITPSSTTVKEEYQLTATDGTKLGDTIKIYKDSSIVSIDYQDDPEQAHYQNLIYTYVDVSGNTQTAYVDMSALVLEAEFGSGVTFSDGVAHGVVDPTSESFLNVGADGFKLSGVQTAINNAVSGAVEGLDADISGNSTHVTVGVKEVDGVITAVTVSENDIASADAIDALSAKTITVATSANGSITTATTTASDGTKSIALETDASKIQMSGFTGTSVLSGISESDSISDAFEEIEDVIEANEQVTAAALTDLEDSIEELSGKTVTAITSNNNSITASINDAAGNKTYNIETDASKISGLTAVADTDIISGVSASDSVKTGIEKLYASLGAEIAARKAAISAASVHGSSAIDVTEAASGDTISLKLDSTTQGTGAEKTGTDNALTITNNGLFLSNTWDCGTYNDNV